MYHRRIVAGSLAALLLSPAAAFAASVVSAGRASASPCDTWIAGSGNWNVPGNWSGGVPGPTTAACITTAGSYIVTVNDFEQAGSLQMGAASGTQPELDIAAVGNTSPSQLQVTGDISNVAKIDLTSQHTGSAQSAYLTWGGTLTNSGTLATDAGVSKGSRYLEGDLVNTGTVAVAEPTFFDTASAQWDNAGSLSVASTGTLTVNGPADFLNDTGGSIANSGTFTASNSSLYTQGAGTETGNAVTVDQASLALSGAGGGSFLLLDSDTLTGNVAAGQSVTVAGVTGTGPGQTLNPGSFTNAGTITLTNVGKINLSSQSATLSWNGTLTNTGTINLQSGEVDDYRYLQGGNLLNQGTIAVTSAFGWLQGYQPTGATLTNKKSITVASGASLTSYFGSLINSAGTIANSGSFVVEDGYFEQGLGKTTGSAIDLIDNATLDFAGTGASKFAFTQNGTLVGNVSAGQTVTIAGVTAANDTTVTAPASFTNAGTINLTTQGPTSGANQNATLQWSGTFTNAGTLNSTRGSIGGGRFLEGHVLLNTGTLSVALTVEGDTVGKWTNAGQLGISASQKVNLANGIRFVQTSAGTLAPGVTTGTIGGITATGPVSLDGTLTISGTPTSGKTYNLVTGATSLSGTFATVNPAGAFTVTYSASGVKVTAA
jgi:hypothetical protein